MENKKKDYLFSLLEWADHVKDQANQLDTDKSKLAEWLKQLDDWKKAVKEKIDNDDEVLDESIYDLQEKSQQLINFLKEIIVEKPRSEANSIRPGNHQLPPLPYAYDSLEPYISKRIMKLHHDKHHQSYVDGLNKAEKELYVNKPDSKLMKHWMREQAFNGSGHYLHTIFWYNMAPNAGGTPNNPLLNQIKKDFGSFKNFKHLFSTAAESVEGVGWAILVWEPRAGRLGIQTVEKHQMFSLWDTIPILVLDVWEHAYYLQYENIKSEYIKNWWNVVNWNHVESRYEEAKKLLWPLY